MWAEPNVDEAAAWMDLLARDPALRTEMGMMAAKTMNAQYSPAAVSQRAMQRISEVFLELQDGE
jgi:hypothetical protein